jgi:CelD/BcsL family acetyltransferase involved in cellulose biosynthesis
MIRLVPLDETTWDTELARHHQATLFHTSRWLNLLQRTHGVQTERLGIFAGGRLCGLFPVQQRRRGPFILMGSPVSGTATPYLGPLVPDELLPATLTAFASLIQHRRPAIVHLGFPYAVNPALVTALGYQFYPQTTLVIPIRGRTRDDLWQGLKKSCRAHVRQAERRGVEISEAQQPDVLEDYLRFERAVFARRGLPPPNPRQYYYELWESLRPAGQMNVFVARCEGHIVGVQINGIYQGKLYGLHGAVDARYRDRCYPGNLLEWHLIAWMADHGLELYDMIGGSDPGWGQFKRSFGSVPVAMTACIDERSRLFTFARAARQAVQRLRGGGRMQG